MWENIIKARRTEIVHNTPLFMELRKEMRRLLSKRPYKRNKLAKERFVTDTRRFLNVLTKNNITPKSEEGKKFLDSETLRDVRQLVQLLNWYESPEGTPPAA